MLHTVSFRINDLRERVHKAWKDFGYEGEEAAYPKIWTNGVGVVVECTESSATEDDYTSGEKVPPVRFLVELLFTPGLFDYMDYARTAWEMRGGVERM